MFTTAILQNITRIKWEVTLTNNIDIFTTAVIEKQKGEFTLTNDIDIFTTAVKKHKKGK